MKRWIAVCILGGGMFAAVPVAAGPLEVGGWLGPRLYSDNSALGAGGEVKDEITGALALGGRVGLPLLRGTLVPEVELVLASTQTDTYQVGVFWFEPRVALRYQMRPSSWLSPYLIVGGGAPVVLSGNTRVILHDISGEGFVGGGATIWPRASFGLRVDARLSLGPGGDPAVAVEGELGVGVTIPLGRKASGARSVRVADADADGDKITDDKDACPARAEDADGVEDGDGCPDIDNDLDGMLDVADKCAMQPESYNGFEDEDGCPDQVPPELAAIIGVVSTIEYRPGDRLAVRTVQLAGTLDRIASLLQANPTVRIQLIGHTDDREAAALAEGGEPDLPLLSAELGRARVSAIRELLVLRGVEEERVLIESRGADEPLEDNGTPAGQRKNRRVELVLVPRSR